MPIFSGVRFVLCPSQCFHGRNHDIHLSGGTSEQWSVELCGTTDYYSGQRNCLSQRETPSLRGSRSHEFRGHREQSAFSLSCTGLDANRLHRRFTIRRSSNSLRQHSIRLHIPTFVQCDPFHLYVTFYTPPGFLSA